MPLFQSAPVGIGILDEKGNIFDMNQALRDMIRITKKSQYKYKFEKSVLNPEDIEDITNQLIEQGYVHNKELILLRNNNEKYTALVDIARLEFSNTTTFLVLQRDISQLKNIQTEILQIAHNFGGI